MFKKVLVRKDPRKGDVTYYVEHPDKDYHSADGFFSKDDLKKSGKIKTNKGTEFSIFDASFMDSYRNIKKTAQTIPLKDLGFILAESGIDKNSIVVDTGSGSGGSACFLARFAKNVHTFDINDANLEQTKKNAEYFGLKNVIIKKQDACENIPVKNADVVLLDLPEPWRAFHSADKALRVGGVLIAYCPQVTQSQQFINHMLEHHPNYIVMKSVEMIERDWKIEGLIVRPRSLSNIHSAFLTFLRKIE